MTQIVELAYPRDFVREGDKERLRDSARPPWFVTKSTPLMTILEQFRRNNQKVAVILDSDGHSIGIITLDHLVAAIFRKPGTPFPNSPPKSPPRARHMIIERSFPGEMTAGEFFRLYTIRLSPEDGDTLSDILSHALDHHPRVGDSATIDGVELTAKEATLLDVKQIFIRAEI